MDFKAIINIKPVKNKANGQLSFSLSKKNLPKGVRDMIKSNKIPSFKIKIEGIDI